MEIIVNNLKSASFDGISAKVVNVEAAVAKSIPLINIVGLASSDIQEAKERAKSALIANNISLPPLKVVINLSPSDLKKSGTHFDLAIALMIAFSKEKIIHKDIFVFGELGLDGAIKSSSLLFPLILSLKEQGLIKNALVPKDALESLKYINEVNFIGVSTLKEAIDILKAPTLIASSLKNSSYSSNKIKINNIPYYFQKEYKLDFKDIKGQERAIRAALIAASGFHNIIFNGNAGSGKSMIAKRMQYILPPLTQKEILSIAKALFLDKKTPSFKPIRPFRSPHHSATLAAVFGGGSYNAKIGEVALANYGILFFDELPHFKSNILEALREPLQDKEINIARVNSKIKYEANFLFIGAMNPCPCGNLLSKTKECRCSDLEIKRYKNKLSDPLLDRMDIFVTMQEVDFKDKNITTSKELHQKVIKAFIAQKNRSQARLNGQLIEDEIDKFCVLEDDATSILQEAIIKFSLSFRSIANIKKVARTIADLNEHSLITKKDILEALSFRKRD